MLIVPAIDLKGGKVVRLVGGDFSEEIVYGEDPVEVARKFEAAGAAWLHVIDLDGALTGTPRHLKQVTEIAKSVKIPVQTGGGIRSAEAIERYLKAGVRRVILGTKACLHEGFITESVQKHGDRIAAAVDVKDGRVTIEGWVRREWMGPKALVDRLLDQGVKTIIYTDASRDGKLLGPAVETLKEILDFLGDRASFIASGGIGTLNDLKQLMPLEAVGLDGVIVGRALYDGKIDLKEAIAQCSPKGSSPASMSKPAGSSKGSGS
ncbi:MAG: 1-(5-phosphoribosyl)-5-[(5-phosphoribosylamino)methylideneamino]imidazole-4-carboxamide isomerase [Candidatus Omnitrophica bacterium CG11_big_fil_rev_8_21_14_0_20_64_10]|nr:MAG: 1-(5-phosphoribosyl)-5-[(5-phosphoribosylamino)methylideneamino]imidazole-4-carboxamide isomerase [Candidatus Omnitrophica bacterium CG11_big_fil_rev_8_21_14_0_20_64_10]